MKSHIIKTGVLFLCALMLQSCVSDDDPIAGTGTLTVEFDNAFANNDLVFGEANTATSNHEILKINSVKYIISNIVLTNSDGTTFTYPMANGYFIVDEADEETHEIELSGVPAGDYVKVKFGLGADQALYDLGENGQGEFGTQAQAAGLLGDWATGYTNLAVSGTFTSQAVSTETPFEIKTGKSDTNLNYNEITLDLPTKALVRKDIAPEIHIITNLAKLVDGITPISLSNAVSGGNANISSASAVQNSAEMFKVAHVHND